MFWRSCFIDMESREYIMERKRDSMNERMIFCRTFGSIPQERPAKDMIWIHQIV